jgi:hypothetical protein
MRKLNVGAGINLVLLLFFAVLFSGVLPFVGQAKNVTNYSDTISDSRPLGQANHTFGFTIKEDVPASGYIDVAFPPGFEVLATSTFGVRNVELYVNGSPRAATTTANASDDGVLITTGLGGSVRYTFNSSTGVSAEDALSLRIGNHTSISVPFSVNFSSSTGTTTTPGDIEPIVNSQTAGTYKIPVTIIGGVEGADGQFNIAIIEAIRIEGVDTTETVPPFRFNGLPDGEIGGTTLAVEMSMETNEFAICKWSQASGTAYAAMSNTFTNTGYGQIVHSTVVPVVAESLNTYYIRCIDDELNFNIDDYIIAFVSPAPPSGTPNADGEVEGNGTGSGNDGTGSGSGGGGETGGQSGESSTTGDSTGGGGSGGGGGGSSGPDSDGDVGGGLEDGAGPYRSGDAKVIINGYAFPGSTVYAVVDGFAAESVTANSAGKYSVTIEEIARGAYTFGVYAIDENDVKSTTFSTSFTVTGGRTSSLSNINIMPSLHVVPDPVEPGQTLTISGFSIPDADITIENQKDGSSLSKKQFTTTSGSNGSWSITVDTNNFSKGTYKVRAKSVAIDGSISSDYSNYTFYGVGEEAQGQINADLSRDGKVNLTDFSILLFWWGGDGGDSSPPADINGDGSVSLTDFSIMLFQWTG